MIQVFADGVLTYDSRLTRLDLLGLKTTIGLNVGGTAEITMPMGHPAYNSYISHKTLVTIYRDGKLRFRGRSLYNADSFYGQRTITCEGELCFLRDSVSRPESYSSTPERILRALINAHNAQVDDFKQFTLGTVTIPDETIKLPVENAEPTLTTVNKLLEACGGYIVFTDAEDGTRAINWLQELTSRSEQVIEFGENLLDFSSTGANTKSLATGIIPYGAKINNTKKRLTIESVNDGKDYIIAEDAQAIRGTIMTSATWEDVTNASTLLAKARAYLEDAKVFITSLELTALDLSYLDKDLDSFSAGDMIRVVSLPHGIDEDFQLTQLTEDLLNPEKSKVTMGKDIQSLTGADVAGDKTTQSAIDKTTSQMGEPVNADEVASIVEQNMAGKYVTPDQLTGYASQEALDAEVSARAGAINKVNGVVNISGGAPINMLGGKIDINGSEINFGKEVRFPNGLGVRIADKDGNFYYVLRVDDANSCVVGNDYTNLYLRGKDAVYLHKTGAVVTSDQREKNSVEELPEAYMAMLDKLTPMRFKYNGRGDRYHVGFIAQDVERAMTEAGLGRDAFGGFVDLNGDGSHLGLAYDEFIGLLLQKIRRLEKRLDEMEGEK
jgi:phage minor structural protein